MKFWPWLLNASVPRPPVSVVLYTKPGCSLCDETRATLERLRVALPHVLTELDIGNDASLMERYGERIPVVAIDGRERCWGRIPVALLKRELRAAARRTALE